MKTLKIFFSLVFLTYSLSCFSQTLPTSFANFSCGMEESSSSGTGKGDNPRKTTIPPGGTTNTEHCDDIDGIRYVKLNYHFILRSDNTGNFTESNDGNGNMDYNGYQRAEDIINSANDEISNLTIQRRRIEGVDYENVDIKVQYILTGVYFHRSDEFFERRLGWFPFAGPELDALGVNAGEVLNVFDVNIAGNYTGVATGFGTQYPWAVRVDNYGTYLAWPEWTDFPRSNLNHEVGHLFDLYHTWSGEDFCDDTPEGAACTESEVQDEVFDCHRGRKANCWTYVRNTTCGDYANISNNIMDYNEGWPTHAYTPCQAERICNTFNTEAGQNYIEVVAECPPTNAFFVMTDMFLQPTNIFAGINGIHFIGMPSFNEDLYRIDICEITDPADPTCISNVFSSDWIAGTVGEMNLDMEFDYTFEREKFYKIILEVINSECLTTSEASNIIYIEAEPDPEPGEPGSPYHPGGFTIKWLDPTKIEYTIEEGGCQNCRVLIDVIDLIGNTQINVLDIVEENSGTYEVSVDFSSLNSGNYFLVGRYNGLVSSVMFSK